MSIKKTRDLIHFEVLRYGGTKYLKREDVVNFLMDLAKELDDDDKELMYDYAQQILKLDITPRG